VNRKILIALLKFSKGREIRLAQKLCVNECIFNPDWLHCISFRSFTMTSVFFLHFDLLQHKVTWSKLPGHICFGIVEFAFQRNFDIIQLCFKRFYSGFNFALDEIELGLDFLFHINHTCFWRKDSLGYFRKIIFLVK
jgi:hypothetical protein